MEDNTVDFSGKQLKLNEECDAEEIVTALNSSRSVEVFRLSGNTLGIPAATAIGKALESHPELKRALWSDIFTGRLKTELPPAIRALGNGLIGASAHLVELDIGDNASGPIGADGFVELLQSEPCFTLQELRLNNMGLGIIGGKKVASALLKCLEKSRARGKPFALKVFQAGRNRLENEGAAALADVFKQMKSLEEIHIYQNGINAPGIRALAEAFVENPKLKVVNLKDNTFTVQGSMAMAKAIPVLKELEVINFGECLVRTQGAIVIAEAIADFHHNLKELDLSFNEIKMAGADAIVQAIKNKNNLRKLDMNGNNLGDGGCEKLKIALQAVDKLKVLDSLSDDEGEEDDEEEYVGGEDEEEEEEEEEEDEEDEYQYEESGDQREHAANGVLHELTDASEGKIQQFLKTRSVNLLKSLQEDDFSTFVQNSSGENLIDLLFELGRCQGQMSQQQALNILDQCYHRKLNSADVSVATELLNLLLPRLGLIKDEKKTQPDDRQMAAILSYLKHITRHFPSDTRKTLLFFLEQRESAALRSAETEKNDLVEALRSLSI